MDLSIIIPCHNLQKHITPLLNTLNLQNFQYEVEILFVLDDCTDYTQTIIDNKINKQKYSVKIIDCCVHSCGLARNIGLDAARGDYIWFIDGDDWILSHRAIQDLLTNIKAKNLDILKFKYKSNSFPEGFVMMVWQYIFKSSFIGTVRFPNIQPNEDVAFTRELFSKVDEIDTLNNYFYYYNYDREGSNMSQYRTKGKIEP